MKKTLLIIGAVFMSFASFAQNSNELFGLGLHLGTKRYAGDLGNEMFNLDRPQLAGGVSISKYLSPSFDGILMLSHGHIGHTGVGTINNPTNATSHFATSIFDVNLLAKYKFNNGYILKEEARIAPFIHAGIGDAITFADHYSFAASNFNFPMGVGLNIDLSEKMSLQWMSTYNFTMSDNYDNYDRTGYTGNKKDQFMFHSIGVVFHFNRKKDKDGDNVLGDATKPKSELQEWDLDQCPNLKGVKSNNGCPEVKEEVKETMRLAMQGLHFETGSATITDDSYPVLDNVVNILKTFPVYKLSIDGHTDNTGDAGKNYELSKNRAKAAMDYIVNKGIEANRVTYHGYGSDRPVMPNDTEQGRAKNRRVEFRVVF